MVFRYNTVDYRGIVLNHRTMESQSLTNQKVEHQEIPSNQNVDNQEKKPYRPSDKVLYLVLDYLYPNLKLTNMPFEWFQFIFKDKPFEEMKKRLNRINSNLQDVIDSGKKSFICPKLRNVWRWMEFMRPEEVKVVILGQDPYHSIYTPYLGPRIRASNGLGFSMDATYFRIVHRHQWLTWTMKSIMRMACDSDDEYVNDGDGDLTSWYRQGVLMFDLYLTTMEGIPEAHKRFGWDYITKLLIERLGESTEPRKVFIFWRVDFSDMFEDYMDEERHRMIFCCHPASCRIIGKDECSHGCWSNRRKNCFKRANRYLARLNHSSPIRWNPLK